MGNPAKRAARAKQKAKQNRRQPQQAKSPKTTRIDPLAIELYKTFPDGIDPITALPQIKELVLNHGALEDYPLENSAAWVVLFGHWQMNGDTPMNIAALNSASEELAVSKEFIERYNAA